MAANGFSSRSAMINVGEIERIGSMVAGTTLVLRAIARPSLARGLLALAGAALLQRGLSGHCAMYQALGIRTDYRGDVEGDAVQSASEDSFPASDPPSWTPVKGPVSEHQPARR